MKKKTVIPSITWLVRLLLIQTLLLTLSNLTSCQIIQSNSLSNVVDAAQLIARPAKVPQKQNLANSQLQQQKPKPRPNVPVRQASGRWKRNLEGFLSGPITDGGGPAPLRKPILISDTWQQQQKAPCSPVNEDQHLSPNYYSGQPDVGDAATTMPNNSREHLEMLEKLLSARYKISPPVQQPVLQQPQFIDDHKKVPATKLIDLPKPTNVTLFIISWYPPILKLSWTLDEFGDQTGKLDFYSSSQFAKELSDKNLQNLTSSSQRQFDLDLALGPDSSNASTSEPKHEVEDEMPYGGEASDDADGLEPKLAAELRYRRLLIHKSLTCFQVTYNIMNSRFKVIEEYPPYLRSIMMERLLPATEYSLRIAAVYLGKYRQFSDRVHFVSPTDNESRRFKENTYRPIHRYPDDRTPLRIGLAQVRSEELTIVAIAVLFWLATICLFFNKWGKIRMLEPYQPAYRESSSTASLITAAAATTDHHHPSLHNLTSAAGSYVGPPVITSATTNATGPTKLASTFQQPAPNNESAQLAASPASSTNTVVAAHSQVTAPATNQLHERRSDGSTAGVAATNPLGRRSSKSMLLIGSHKRFESLTGDPLVTGAGAGTGGGSGANSHDLNYLFQSKALALAKATSIWSRHQQKLRLLQCRAAALQNATVDSNIVPSSLQQLGAFRRTSQALLRQRGTIAQHQLTQLQNASSLQHQSLEQFHQISAAGGSLDRRRESRVPTNGGIPAAADLVAASRAQLLKRSHQSQIAQAQGDWRNSWSLDKQQADSGGEQVDDCLAAAIQDDVYSARPDILRQQLDQRASNKLRRLLFTTRSHQHHHIATSTSSSTIQASGSSLSTSQQPSPLAHNNNSSGGFATPKMGSTSLDNDQQSSNTTIRQRLDSANQRPQQLIRATPPPSQLSDAGSAISLPAPIQRQMADANATSSLDSTNEDPTTSRYARDETPQRCASAVPMSDSAPICEMGTRLARGGHKEQHPHQRQSLMEHHILIEPPSPPNQRDLLEFQSSECLMSSGELGLRQHQAFADDSQALDLDTVPDVEREQSSGTGQHKAGCRLRQTTNDAANSHVIKPQQQIGGHLGHGDGSDVGCCMQLDQRQAASSCHPSGRPLACRHRRLDNKSPPLAPPPLPLTGASSSIEQQLTSVPVPVPAPTLDPASSQASADWQPCQPATSDYCCLAQAASYSGKPLSLAQDLQDNTPQTQLPSSSSLAGPNYQQEDNSRHGVDFSQLEDCDRSSLVERRAREAFARLVDYQQETAAAVAAAALDRHCLCCCCPNHCPIATSMTATAASCARDQQTLAQAQQLRSYQQLLPRQHSRHRSLCTEIQQLSTAINGNQHHRGSVQFQVSDHSSSSALTVDDGSQATADNGENRPRMSSIFVSSPYTRAHRDSFAMLRALSQKKSKSAEDVAYLSSLVLQIWSRDPNPLLQSVSHQHLTQQSSTGSSGGPLTRRQASVAVSSQPLQRRHRPKSSLTVAHI